MTSFSANTVKQIVFVVFPEIKLLDIAGPMQVFTDANVDNEARYNISVVSLDGGNILTDTVLPVVSVPIADLDLRAIDTLIIVGGGGSRAASEDTKLITALKGLVAGSRRIGSVCSGAFVLAATGLLDGRRAVTHWDSCDYLAEKFPQVQIETDPIYIKDGDVWTSAGVTAGIDMALAMVAEDFGKPEALAVARSLVTYMVRPGGQSQFSTTLLLQSNESAARFDELHNWMQGNLGADLRVEKLAQVARMSPRNFARLYTSETGCTPAKSVENMRVEMARQLLEDTDHPIKVVALKCGFRDEERLRRAMGRVLNASPSDYRKRFRPTG